MGHINRTTVVDCSPRYVFGVLEGVERMMVEGTGTRLTIRGVST